MKHTCYYIIMLALVFCACSNEDDIVAVSDTYIDRFAPPAGATDEESQIRREFYQAEGAYLLFNDTLLHEQTGTDRDGNPVYRTELLEITYSIGSTSALSRQYRYNYLQTIEEKRAAANFMRQSILPHLDKSVRPFSWLLVNEAYSYTMDIYMNETKTNYVSVDGERATVLALGGNLSSLSDSQADDLALDVFVSYLGSKFLGNDEVLADFYAVTSSLYGVGYSSALNPTASEVVGLEIMKEAGFICNHYLDLGFFKLFTWQYPTRAEDINAFVELVFRNTMEEIEQQYSGFPIVIQKARILNSLITSLGYIP